MNIEHISTMTDEQLNLAQLIIRLISPNGIWSNGAEKDEDIILMALQHYKKYVPSKSHL